MPEPRFLRVGFVGTGIMGGHMARRLAEAGFTVSAWNRSPEKSRALTQFGVHVADTPQQAAYGVDVLVCMLSSGPVCDAVLFGEVGATRSVAPGATVLVMSSIAPVEAQAQAARAAESGLTYVDAPVSGGETGARDGTLAIMAGGSADAVAHLAPLLACFGRTTHVGPVGAGSLTKLANQMIVATTIGAVAEALTLAEAGGADPRQVRAALLGGFAESAILRQHGLRMVTGAFEPGGPAKYQTKDTRAILDVARNYELDLPLIRTADGLFQSLIEHGGGDLDHSALILEIKRLNGLGNISMTGHSGQ